LASKSASMWCIQRMASAKSLRLSAKKWPA
jgi:hypothetical protein